MIKRLRKWIQAGWGLLTNGYVRGFLPGGSAIYICPLGAFYALFQKVSIVRMKADEQACINCGACSRACAMGVDPSAEPNSAECIRCGECLDVCPVHALCFTALGKELHLKSKGENKNEEKPA